MNMLNVLNGATLSGRFDFCKCHHNHNGDNCNSRLNGSNQKAGPENKAYLSLSSTGDALVRLKNNKALVRSSAESELLLEACLRPLLAVLARVVISGKVLRTVFGSPPGFVHRYRLTFLPWSWPPFIKSSTDTPAGSAPPPPSTQNGPRLNKDSYLIHFA